MELLHEEQKKTLEAKELALEKLYRDFGEQIVMCKDKYNRLKSELEQELNDIQNRKKVAIRETKAHYTLQLENVYQRKAVATRQWLQEIQ